MSYTPEEITEILEAYFDSIAHRQYIGSRYVPIFGRVGESSCDWDNTGDYEPLTIVLYQGNSYTSRQFVPAGADIGNTDYWVLTGNFNAQVEQYRLRLVNVENALPIGSFDSVNTVEKALDALNGALPIAAFDDVNTVSAAISAEAAEREEQDDLRALAFDTVADMAACSELEEGFICHTNGFHTADDGGAAWYEIKSTGTANEMDVIACGDLFAHLVITTDFVTPVMFGAYGDGTHGDSASIQRAFDVFPFIDGLSKTYLFDNINYDSVNQIAGVIIEASCHVRNMKAIIAADATDYFTPFNVNDGKNAVFENVTIDGTHSGTHTGLQDGGLSGIKTGFDFTGMLVIENCTFENCFTDGLQLRYDTNLVMRDSTIKANGRNGITANCKNTAIYDCAFVANGTRTAPYSQFHIEPDTLISIDMVLIKNCTFTGTRNCSIKVDCANGINVNKIVIEDCIDGASDYTHDSFDFGDRANVNVTRININRCSFNQMLIRTATHTDTSTIAKLTVTNSKLVRLFSSTAKEIVLDNCELFHSLQTYASTDRFVAKSCKWDCNGISAVADCIPLNNAAPASGVNSTSVVFDNCEFVNVAAGIVRYSCKDVTLNNCRHMTRSANMVPSGFTGDYLLVSNCWFGASGSAASFTIDDSVPGCITGSIFYRSSYYAGAGIVVAGNKTLS